ncbi:uncharacterized protein LOC111064137 isoform X2 [Nilaparvata lugens]|uniref:uncharacterized protein LOC111064137 isoform X1 n=1 Tax=Nilaparvata lugens TaxID=108931 RepID=UPI00193D2008|nr:uncharacterized protein LOC111064137 isoform X1 [Nilaparvata lugens]XP_039295772.1 uncharacterized protein LOC111064137 isoform X2 [Nilaparvata lugens]
MKWLRFVVSFMLRFLNRNAKSREMSRKSFHICVDFDVHAVTCPGVWLCPKGRIELRIAMLGLSVNTKAIAPSFPLLFHEKFRFHKMLRSVNSLTALQGVLKSRNLHIQLLHTTVPPKGGGKRCQRVGSGCTTVLATFRSPIQDVFYPPSPASHNLNVGTDVDLLLKPTNCFPGIISPKAEISTRVVIEEVVNYCSPERVINPVTVSSKAENRTEDVSPLVRQRAVCHSDTCQCCDCYKAKKNSNVQTPFLIGPLPRRPGFRPKQHKRLTKTRNRSAAIESKKLREEKEDIVPHINCNCDPPEDEEGSTVCKCILCRKYKDYFPSGDYSSSELDNKPKPKPKKNTCKYCCGDQKEMRKQRQSSSPVKQLENCCPCMLLNIVPVIDELDRAQENEYGPSYKNLQADCPNCINQIEPRSITVLKSALGGDVTADQRWMGDRSAPGIQGCSCGIYSCHEWRRKRTEESTIKQRQESSRLDEKSDKAFRDGRKNFYLSLEEYYRQLYARARQRSSAEFVNACA